jgi:pimeloyl-ACP methyl ester carboxylesterase
MPIEHAEVLANGINFHVATAGPADGPPVLLLHGFPECGYGWRHQMEPLAEAGMRVVAPDLRGYGGSAKPTAVSAYALDTLADDVCALAHQLGFSSFAVVGHDWGGIVAWHLAARDPQRLRCVAVLNAPHPATLSSFMLAHPLQIARSAYVGFFQLPWVPEVVLGANDHALLALSLTRSSRAGTFNDQALDAYRAAWSRPGALSAMLGWYRAMPLARPLRTRIGLPVRVLWGDADMALAPGLAEAGAAFCERCDLTHFAGATHWLHHEIAQEVNTQLVEFLQRHAVDG